MTLDHTDRQREMRRTIGHQTGCVWRVKDVLACLDVALFDLYIFAREGQRMNVDGGSSVSV